MPVISTNNAANAALNYLNNNSSKETNQLAMLASGSRVVQASDDAAGLAIGTQLQAGATVFQQDQTNVQQGTAILQTADGDGRRASANRCAQCAAIPIWVSGGRL